MSDGSVQLHWTFRESGTPLEGWSYSVYRNDTLVAVLDETEYDEEIPGSATTYYVRAVNDDGTERVSNAVTVAVLENPVSEPCPLVVLHFEDAVPFVDLAHHLECLPAS